MDSDIKQKPVVIMKGAYLLHQGRMLVGLAFGHPRFEDGSFVFSSEVIKADLQLSVVETLNTIYHVESWNVEQKSE